MNINMSLKAVSALFLCVSLTACATRPSKIDASYVSPLKYQDFSCSQLRSEAERVSSEAIKATGAQKKQVTRDAVAVGVAVAVFWPAAFFVKGNGATEAEVARLKGEMGAIEEVSQKKKCNIEFSQK